jgi:ABC-type sugar transport system substrate-binding protein/AraC-like DNA-binding protein
MNNIKTLLLVTLTALACMCISCTKKEKHYVIGVSQCSDDIWREKQNAELRMGNYFHNNVELRFAAAYDSDQRQIEQIDSLVACGIDLLIVAPNQVATISPAIDRAYDSGIPVIVFERKTNSQKFTAFMSADNYEMGRQMGEYIAKRLNGSGKVLEVMGLKGSSPAIERHKGFADALKNYPKMEIAATLQGDWTEETGYDIVKKWKKENPTVAVDMVFGMNDRSAIGARKAFLEAGDNRPLYCGIDGLPGQNGGIKLVNDSVLDASFIYPTNGDRVLQLAIDILEGKPYEKETLMMSAIVTHDNAGVLLMQTEETMRQEENLDRLHQMADSYLKELDTQRMITWMAFGGLILLIAVIVLLYLYRLGKITLRRERMVNSLWELKKEELPTLDSPASGDDTTLEAQTDKGNAATSIFFTRFKDVVEATLEDSELGVEELASEMNLSRVQLYRKVKAITGASPVELLRTARLKRGYQMLMTTDMSISEVAYKVGFTAPSYFTKCFKDEYGILPGDVRGGNGITND